MIYKFSMKNIIFISFFILSSQARVIYGPDNRLEVFESPKSAQVLASSVATLIKKNNLRSVKGDKTKYQLLSARLMNSMDEVQEEFPEEIEVDEIPQEQPSEELPVDISDILNQNKAVDIKEGELKFCPDLKYINQRNPGICSGFLIGPDLLLTAGHCGKIENYCEKYRWVFDFKLDKNATDAPDFIQKENVYSCKKVIAVSLSLKLNMDFNLIQLDRVVTNRSPLKYRTSGTVSKDEPLLIIGSPNGLPLKVAGGANVRSSHHPLYFTANLDSFQGNSGSPVFNALTNTVEGILVRGAEDYTPDFTKQCIGLNFCENNACRGEDVTKINSIPEIGVQPLYFSLALSGDVMGMSNLLKTNFWRDIYDQRGVTALMRAASSASAEMLSLLVKEKVDPNLRDVNGDSAVHYLVRSKKFSEEALVVLSQAKADLNQKNLKGDAPLHLAAESLQLTATKKLIELGADKQALNDKGENCLFSFARAGKVNELVELTSLGVDASVKNKNNETVFSILKKVK